jgi:hypothetical protein
MPTIVGQMVEKLQHVNGQVGLYPHNPDPDAIRPSVAVVAADRGSVSLDAADSPGSRQPRTRPAPLEVRKAGRDRNLPEADL